MKKRKDSAHGDGVLIIAIFAFIFSLISLMNPHLEYTDREFSRVVEVSVYHEFSSDGRLGTYPGMIMDTVSIDCTDGVMIEDNFDCLSCGRKIIETYGSGVCIVKYNKQVRVLRWF